MAVFVRVLLILLVPYLLVCLAMYLLQSRLVYFPDGAPRTTPASSGMRFEELEIASGGERLSAWYLPVDDPWSEVLVCNGNAGSIADRLDLASTFHHLGWSVLLFDYRGYGKSTGTPDEDGTYTDAVAAYDALAEKVYDPGAIVVYGESLGGAVAVQLALRRPVAAVVIESAFTSLPDVGAAAYPFLPVRLLSRFSYDTLSKVARLEMPLMVVHSVEDETVPVEHGYTLAQAAGVELFTTDGGHNDGGFRRRPEWVDQVGAFLRTAIGR